jgi:hypothetical protein
MSTSSAGAAASDRCDVRKHADAIDDDGGHRNERSERDASTRSIARDVWTWGGTTADFVGKGLSLLPVARLAGARVVLAHEAMPPSCQTLLPSSLPFLWSNATGDPPPASFHSAWVSPDGLIVEKRGCQAVRNGGCAKHMYKRWEQPSTATAHARVVTLATHFGDGHYHFPMEALTALASSSASFEPGGAVTLHVSKKTEFVLSWLALVGHANTTVVDGDIFAASLRVPRPGRCSDPSKQQVRWLRNLVLMQLGKRDPLPKGDSLVLIRRANFSQTASNNKRRVIASFETTVQAPAEAYARAHALRFALFDDAALPPLREQLALFTRAAIVVAPLGAGELGMVASPSGACLVELADPTRVDKFGGVHPHLDATYARLASLLGHKYEHVPTPGLVADSAAVRSAMQRCSASAKLSSGRSEAASEVKRSSGRLKDLSAFV